MFFKYCVVLCALLVGACASVPEKSTPTLSPEENARVAERLKLAGDIQAFEHKFGLAPTENFRSYDPLLASYDICYRAGILALDGQVANAPKDACDTSPSVFDSMLYRAQAIANIKTPITASFLRAPTARFVMVVFHEDFHEQMIGVPSHAIDESATTLMGLLYAREFMRATYGDGSPEHNEIIANITAFLAIAKIETRFEGEFSTLYRRAALGKISRVDALAEKKLLFGRMHAECAGLSPTLLMPCDKVMNNAELSNALLFSRHFPLFYDLYLSCEKDVQKTGLIISGLAHEKLSEDEYVRRIMALITNRCTP